MGNTLNRLLSGCCFKPSTTTSSHDSQSLGPHGVTSATVGVSALAQDLLNFDTTSRVPEGLSRHVISSRKAQARWYQKLLGVWRGAENPPRTAEEATWLVVQALKGHQKEDIEGFLSFYGLPPAPEIEVPATPPCRPEGVEYVLQTLPVDAMSVVDGDGINVYVDTADPRESSTIPLEVQEAAIARARARSVRDFQNADALHRSIVAAGYRVITGPNGEETLARKYKIRLRGIDAPENEMPYGKEAREALRKLVEGKRLRVSVYGNDRYGRFVADVHCNGIFVQEKMLKRGFAWHYTAYDQRPEFAVWEEEARSAQRGLWALSNPEKPWDWRKDRRNAAQISVC